MWIALPLIALSLSAHVSANICPCAREDLCEPIRHQPALEVVVFDVGGKAWKFYDWSKVTTVAAFGKFDAELMCYAHSKGARLVLKGDVSLSDIVDPVNRTTWIQGKVQLAKSQFMDGINIDIEQAVEAESPQYYALTALVKETTESFHKEIPGSQINACYDYVAIADSCDLLFVMSYDEQSQIWGDCIALANAPFNQTLTAYDQYISMKIDPKKLVMGLPWYGYDYTCLNFSKDGVCTIPKVPFRGAPCSDASGRQISYRIMMKQINSSMSGRLWDDNQRAPYYNYKDTEGRVHQVWYDDPESIALKAAYVAQHGLKGIGMWNGNLLDYSADPIARQQTSDMWNALTPSSHRETAAVS
ncbi:Di-N-acetylchitobiase [Triplophysa tibetana]|uniref:Di-N-acetylchitobiase n=1 Tax=Triplophysa tibetana TaxID=1572043 RepID=A0A5A9NF66_9TELE|nr:Di-N-acetylchitobiase [Triplophysa tibetana]